MTAALAATEPWWEPGTRHAYHTNTYGHLVGEIVRRASGEMPGERLRAVGRVDRCRPVVWPSRRRSSTGAPM